MAALSVWVAIQPSWAQTASPATVSPVAADAVAADPASPVVVGDVGAKVDELLKRLTPFGFSGAALVAKDGKVILSQGYGLSDRKQKIPVTPETVFDIGSITKQFTGAAILKLEMLGKLKVQDPISKYFKGVPPDKEGITLHHLLTHSSGLVGDFGGDYDAMTREGIIEATMQSKLQWAPGTRYRYSNAGFSLLGAVIEMVYGQSYESFLQEQLFKPSGMSRTGYRLPAWQPGQVARGYGNGQDHGTPLDHAWAADGPYWNLRANGGILSTIGDMYRWHVALSGESVLSSAAKGKLFAPHMAEGPNAQSHYGYGWVIERTPRGTKLITHNGGSAFGFHADFRRYVDENIVVFIASNAELSAIQADQQIARILFGMECTMPPAAVPLDPTLLASYAGNYETTTGGKLEISAADGKVEVLPANPSAFKLLSGAAPSQLELLEQLNRRTADVMEALVKNDYRPIHAALGGQRTLEEVQARYEPPRREMEAAHGSLQSVEVIGTIPFNEDMGTIVRLIFERGSERIQLIWARDRLLGMRLAAPPITLTYVPESITEFASYRLGSASPPKLSFRMSGHGGSTLLTIRASDGDIVARKTQ